MRRKALLYRFAVALLLAILVTSFLPVASAESLEGSIQCPCDCGKFLPTCDCDTAAEARSFIQGLSDNGLNDGEIAKEFEKKYGAKYVNFVPKEGRGLSLWLLPPLGVVVGGAAIYYRLKSEEGRRGIPRISGVTEVCGSCGEPVRSGADFCSNCGAETSASGAAFCSSCGTELSGDERFCPGCGETT